jgi:hypothetical protein
VWHGLCVEVIDERLLGSDAAVIGEDASPRRMRQCDKKRAVLERERFSSGLVQCCRGFAPSSSAQHLCGAWWTTGM